jgi:hypothetical protein
MQFYNFKQYYEEDIINYFSTYEINNQKQASKQANKQTKQNKQLDKI